MDWRSIGIFFKAAFLALIVGASMAFYFFNIRRRDLFGGFIGAFVIAVIGAIIGGLVLDSTINWIMKILANDLNYNVIGGFIGAFVTLYIMNWLNHNKERKKY